MNYRKEFGHFIDGEWIGSASGETIQLQNPSTGENLAAIAAGGPDDADRAVRAADAALVKWSLSTSRERQELILELANRLRARSEDFAMLETLNNGKPIAESVHFDLPNAIGQFELFAGAPYWLDGSTHDYPDAMGFVHREPIGVCVQIIPWNVPLIMMAAKIAPALAAGNTVVLKPAESVCLSILAFIDEVKDIIPKGVINIVTGYGPDVGEALVTHPLTGKVSFTGSVPTGRKILQYASQNIIPQTLELGGKSAQIVCPSANVDAAVEGAIMSTVLNKGEICLAGSRVLVHESLQEEFLEKLKAGLEHLRIGDPTNMSTQLGALASKAQLEKVSKYIQIGVDEGAKVLTGGERVTGSGLESGCFMQPTVFVDVDENMRIAQEEIFGPVLCVQAWKDEAEAIRIANATPFGLAGGIWTHDLTQAHRIARNMKAGIIWVNRYFNMKEGLPIGGYKQSGFGREFALQSLDAYTQTKSVILNMTDEKVGIYDH